MPDNPLTPTERKVMAYLAEHGESSITDIGWRCLARKGVDPRTGRAGCQSNQGAARLGAGYMARMAKRRRGWLVSGATAGAHTEMWRLTREGQRAAREAAGDA